MLCACPELYTYYTRRWGTSKFMYSANGRRTVNAIGCYTHTYSGCTKMPFDQSGPHGDVKCHASLRNGTPIVQGSAGLPMLCNLACGSRTWLGSHTHPYSGCAKMRFRPQWSACSEVLCAFPESYTYFIRRWGTAKFMYSAYC